ncbi:MAG: hypothetical protein M3424_00710 [Actinomycetota bacterium]|jgi:hypothetical protein|nr:hypothetical protein [Actinomycetota bacterium]
MTAGEVLRRWREHARVRFVPDDQSYAAVDWTAVCGYRQIADTYLVL